MRERDKERKKGEREKEMGGKGEIEKKKGMRDIKRKMRRQIRSVEKKVQKMWMEDLIKVLLKDYIM